MAKIIEMDEAMNLLRQNRNHYLWNKPIRIWNENDVVNLREGRNINYGNIMRDKNLSNKKHPGKNKMNTNGIMLEVTTPQGAKIICESVIHASKVTNVKMKNIYNAVKGEFSKTEGYKFNKILEND